MDFTRRIKLIVGMVLSAFVIFPAIVGLMTGEFLEAMGIMFEAGAIGIVLFGVGIYGVYLICDAIFGKDSLSKDTYDKMVDSRMLSAMLENVEYYQKELVDNEEYILFCELSKKLPSIFSNYAREVLNSPIKYTKPVSPTTAAYVGTQIGGLAVGLVAAQEAQRKQLEYIKNAQRVILSEIAIGDAKAQAEKCIQRMVSILNTNDKLRDHWNSKVLEIEKEIKSQYKVR